MTDPRRSIPPVDRLLTSAPFAALLSQQPRALVVEALQTVQDGVREGLMTGAPAPAGDPTWYAERTRAALARLTRRSLLPLINATGVVLHTNLGRAPLAQQAIDAMTAVARGYSNLEYDVERGARGSRYEHCARLLLRLTGAEAALVVNNNAAALVLVLNTLARGREAVISRGELVEIGGSFRIPEIMARAGTHMIEVGATNRTHAQDYAAVLRESTAVILKVHPSNFRVTGFTAEVDVPALRQIVHGRDIPIAHDLGSGLVIPAELLGLPYEPTAADALRAGADIVTMSGDKLLGGPQAGIIVGRAALIERMRQNPLCRALRVDKLTLAALEATLALYLDPARALREIPVLRMLTAGPDELRSRADVLAAELRAAALEATVHGGHSAVGGGAFPQVELPTALVRIETGDPVAFEARLRGGDPPIVARLVEDRVTLDLRTILPADEAALVRGVLAAAAA